jgi:chromosome segregation ATPase
LRLSAKFIDKKQLSNETRQLELSIRKPIKATPLRPHSAGFYAAFGKDEFGTIGNDTTINSADFDRVNLIAIQALEKRKQRIKQLEKGSEELKKMMLPLRKEMDELKKKGKV